MSLVTVADMRDAGVTGNQATNDRLTELISFWESWVGYMTGMLFTETTLTIDLEGTGCDTLWLPLPIITCSSLMMNSNFQTVIDAATYTVFNRPFPDDRWNPKIVLDQVSESIYEGIFDKWEHRIFKKDLMNRVVGTWGFVESDKATPPMILYLIQRLIILNIDKPVDFFKNWSRKLRLNVKSEKTDYHSYSLGPGPLPGVDSLTGDKELDQILMFFRKAKGPKVL